MKKGGKDNSSMKQQELKLEINKKTKSFGISLPEFNNVVLQDGKEREREVLKRSLMFLLMRHNHSK